MREDGAESKKERRKENTAKAKLLPVEAKSRETAHKRFFLFSSFLCYGSFCFFAHQSMFHSSSRQGTKSD